MIAGEGEATATTMLGDAIEEYLALVRAFPLIPIRDDKHLAEAIAVFEPLFEKAEPTPAEEAYWMVLADLIERYEDAHTHFPKRTGLDALRSLIAENEMTQAELAPVFGTQSVASEVLSGRRELSTTYMKRLGEFFNVSPATFLDPQADC
jgi:HTH-type transcriptional regulator/antitoxin HigA